MVAISRGYEPPTVLGLQSVLAHQTAYPPAIDNYPAMARLSTNPPIAISLKLVADRGDDSNDSGVVSFHRRGVVGGRARHAHHTAIFGDRDRGAGDDRFSTAVRFSAPPVRNSISSAFLPTMPFEFRDLRRILLKKIVSDALRHP